MWADMSMMVCLLYLDTVSWVHMVKGCMDLHIVVEVEAEQELKLRRLYIRCLAETKTVILKQGMNENKLLILHQVK